MEWSELDFDTGLWTIPAERAKNKLAHLVPLCASLAQAPSGRDPAPRTSMSG
jgi:hypothetical protein